MDVRNRLALAIDVDDIDRAEQLAKEVAPWFGVAKVGLELYSAAGPEAIARMRALDFAVFADIKLHDIPTTVGRAARVLGRQGVSYLNFHAAGGVEMLRAGVEGLAEGARDGDHEAARPDRGNGAHERSGRERVRRSTRRARSTPAAVGSCVRCTRSNGCTRRVADFVTIVPGVRFADGNVHDQARVGTPEAATRAGGNILVIGRAVTAADDPRAAAQRVYDSVVSALTVD